MGVLNCLADRLPERERFGHHSDLKNQAERLPEREDSETCGSKDSDGSASKENEALQKQPPASQPSAEDMKKQREALLEAQVKHEREILAKFEQGALARWTGSKDTKRSK